MIEQEKHGTCGSIKEEYGMSPPRLSPDEILALQEGEEVIVTWHGGNGPHLYSIYHDPHDLSRWDEPLGVSREELITSARYVSRPSPTHKKKKTLPELIDSITDPATALAALEEWRGDKELLVWEIARAPRKEPRIVCYLSIYLTTVKLGGIGSTIPDAVTAALRTWKLQYGEDWR